MKIHQIEIENLASLKGRQIINFADLLCDEKIFAITGPTGSGKSTILKAMTLALYGKTYKSNLSSSDYVTNGESIGQAKVSFSTARGLFHAHWSCKVLKNDGLPIKNPTPQRLLFNSDGTNSHLNVPDIIGLSFEQFCRTVVLNQGEFSKFLMSTFSERRVILEQMADTQELSLIGRHLRNEMKTHEIKTQGLETTLGHFKPIDKNDLLNKENELASIEQELLGQEVKITEIRPLVAGLTKLISDSDDLIDREEKYQQELNLLPALKIQKEQIRKDLQTSQEQINRHVNNSIEREQLLILAIQKINDNKRLTKNLDFYLSKLEENQRQKNNVAQANHSIDEKWAKLSKEIIPSFNKYGPEELKKLRLSVAHYEKCQIELNNELRHSQRSEREIAEKKEQQKQFTLKMDQLTKKLQERFGKGPHENFEAQLNSTEDELKNLEIFKRFFHQFLSENQITQEEAQNANASIAQMQHKLTIAKEKFSSPNSLSMEQLAHFHHLIETSIIDDQCALCEHHHPNVQLLNAKKEKLGLEKDSLDKQEYSHIDLAVLQTNIEQSELRISEIQAQLKRKHQHLLEMAQKLGIGESEMNLKYIQQRQAELENDLKTKKSVFQNAILMRKDIDHIAQTKSQESLLIQKAQHSCQQAHEKISLLKKNLHTIFEKLVVAFPGNFSDQENFADESQQFIQNLENNINHQRELSALQKERDHLVEKANNLAREREEYVTQKIHGEEEVALNNSYIQKNNISEHPQDELLAIKEMSSQLQDKLEAHKQGLHQNENEINVRQQKISSLQEVINEKKSMVENSLNDLLEITQASDTLSINKLKDILPPTLSGLGKASIELNTLLTQTLCPALNDLESSSVALKHQSIAKKSELNFEKSQFEQLLLLRNNLKELKERYQVLTALNDVLGREEFRNFSLGLLEKTIIDLANKELEFLCEGRYEIEQHRSANGHDFFIVDRWNDSHARKVSTLSGGETFLVSLALAFGLCEMARGKVEIESFFVDEGFGSLDERSIDEVLEVLMGLEGRGQTLGLISHVKALTSRVPININIRKNQMGHGVIEIIQN